jgi:hypothetical protein
VPVTDRRWPHPPLLRRPRTHRRCPSAWRRLALHHRGTSVIDARLAAPSSSGDATGAAAPPRAVDAQLTRSARPIHTSRACAPTLNAQRGPRSRRARGTASLTALAGRRCHHCAPHLTQLRSACSSVSTQLHTARAATAPQVAMWHVRHRARRPRALSSARFPARPVWAGGGA